MSFDRVILDITGKIICIKENDYLQSLSLYEIKCIESS